MRAREQQLDTEKLVFKPAFSYSPYMEMALEDLNTRDLMEGQEIEINPYYRFYPIFKDMFPMDLLGEKEIRDVLFNILIHFIGENDVKKGLCRKEYYMQFLLKDIEVGIFGWEVKEGMEGLTIKERDTILLSLLVLYRSGASLELLQYVVKGMFPHSILYNNQEDAKELLVYLGVKRTKKLKLRIGMVVQMFARIDYHICFYWEYHFGILGVEETMEIDGCVLY